MNVSKKLGFGLMRLPLLDPDDAASIDLEQVKKMVDLFLSKGFTYFDTAWMYHRFKSEEAVKECLVSRHDRNSFTLATKLNAAFFDSLDGRDEIFNAQLQKTGAGYFDFYLLHAVDADSYEKFKKFDCFRWLLGKKEQGLVRHIGFSFHDKADVLDRVLTEHPEVEFVQLQLNYLDWESKEVESRKCYETCVRHGKPVVVMEGVKGGRLAALSDAEKALLAGLDPAMSEASWAVRFCATLPNVMVVLSGMSSLAQMEDNTSYMENFVPLTDKEREILLNCAESIRKAVSIPCTGCSYCTDGCPMNIAIPRYFALYNESRLKGHEKAQFLAMGDYEDLTKEFGKPSDCVECGQCEGTCPQHLPVIELLKKVSAHFE